MDNLTQTDTQTQTQDTTQTTTQDTTKQAPAFSWKNQLPPDYANAPTMQKFEDNKDGFAKAIQSHLLLEKLLGHEKVPVPKDANDTAAWDIFSKAMKIPEKPEGYALPDVEIPESMKALSFDKKSFSEIMHKHKLTPEAAKGVWEAYTNTSKQAYANAVKAHEEKITNLMNQLRGEWGDAYQSKIQIGQMVLNKFSENQEANDELTAMMLKSPHGVKFLAKVGEQFSENKIGDFRYERHSFTPDELDSEISVLQKSSAYTSSVEKEREPAIRRMNELIAAKLKIRGQA